VKSAFVLEGREPITVAHNLIGAADALKAPPGTTRGDYALYVQNSRVHGSDRPENAEKEIALWFRPEELATWTPVDTRWIAGE
jgi:nucleoside-diphosphate kinase